MKKISCFIVIILLISSCSWNNSSEQQDNVPMSTTVIQATNSMKTVSTPQNTVEPAAQNTVNSEKTLTREEALKRAWANQLRPASSIKLGETKMEVNFCGVRPYTLTYNTEATEVEPNIYGVTIVEDWNVVLNEERVVRYAFYIVTPNTTELVYQSGGLGSLGNCSTPENLYGTMNGLK